MQVVRAIEDGVVLVTLEGKEGKKNVVFERNYWYNLLEAYADNDGTVDFRKLDFLIGQTDEGIPYLIDNNS